MIAIKKDIVVDKKDKKHNLNTYFQQNYNNKQQ